MNNIRQPAVAGMFYPSSPKELKKMILDLLETTKPEKEIKNIFGLVVPHAGYIYSGKTAAFAFNHLKEKNIKTVIVISPSHREYFPGISIYNADGYETPLGVVEIDKKLRDYLINDSKIIFSGEEGHRNEHAVEVQLPFLQTVLNDFKFVPIVMGDQGDMFVNELALKLSSVVDVETVVIASSDLSHYYPKYQADKLDSILERRIINFEFDELQQDLKHKNCEACGGGPIVATMKAASLKNKLKSEVFNRSDSGDVTNDDAEVVGYLSAAIYGD